MDKTEKIAIKLVCHSLNKSMGEGCHHCLDDGACEAFIESERIKCDEVKRAISILTDYRQAILSESDTVKEVRKALTFAKEAGDESMRIKWINEGLEIIDTAIKKAKGET